MDELKRLVEFCESATGLMARKTQHAAGDTNGWSDGKGKFIVENISIHR